MPDANPETLSEDSRTAPRHDDALAVRCDALGPAFRGRQGGIEPVAGSGSHVTDAAGTDLLDANVDSAILGHANPHVADAIVAAVGAPRDVPHGLQRASIELGERLVATLPAPLSNVMFTDGHSAAVDLALRIIRSASSGRGIIVTHAAFHGVTPETLSISPALVGRAALPGWVRVVAPPSGDSTHFCEQVALAAGSLRDSADGLAGLVIDPSFSTDGLAAAHGLERAALAVRAAGGFVVSDESQTGFGRLGSHRWGFEATGFSPDAIVLGTSLANGLPLAAVILRPDLASAFATTTGTSAAIDSPGLGARESEPEPLAVAAALAMLDTIESADLLLDARTVGEYLRRGLVLLASAFDTLGDVRGCGLLLAVDAVTANGSPSPEGAAALVAEFEARDVLIGRVGHVLTVRPALVFSIADADRLLEAAYAALLATDTPLEIPEPDLSVPPAADPAAAGADDGSTPEAPRDTPLKPPRRGLFR